MFNFKNVIYVAIIFVTLVVCFNIQDYFGSLLASIGKKALNSREIIWPKAIALISQKPLFGWGVMSDEQIEGYLLYGASHAHNIILELLLDIGIVGSLIFSVWVYKVLRKNAGVKKKYMYILQVCIACYALDAIFDFYFGLVYFWLIMFSFDLISKYEIENSNINKENV